MEHLSKHHLGKPTQEGSIIIQSIDYSRINRNHERLRPGSYPNYITDETDNTSPNTANQSRNKGNFSSTSADTSLRRRASYNASRKKRCSKINILSKASKADSKHSVHVDKVCSLIVKKLESEENLSGYPKLTCVKPQQVITDLLTHFDSESIEAFREDCRKIETVFLSCGRTDEATRTSNLNILVNLYKLVSCGGGIEWKPRENVVRYITHYLCKNPSLLSQLVYIMTDSTDLDACLYAIKILYELLVRGDRFDKDDRKAMIIVLSCPTILETLIGSMYFIDLRFTDNSNYRLALQRVHSQILQIITTICKSNQCREQLMQASEGTIRLIGKLTSNYWRNKDLSHSLLDSLKIISLKRKNCKYLTSPKFFDGLCLCCQFTNKLFTTTKVLEAMSKSKSALECMSENKNVITLILDLIFYNGKKTINKQAVFTTLYRIVKTENGFNIFSSHEMYNKLYQHFIKNEKVISRPETLKAYTILNRIGHIKIFPSIKLYRGICLPVKVKEFLDMENVLHKTHSINDTDEESQDDDDDDSVVGVSPSTPHPIEQSEPLSDMSPFYVEQLLSTGQKHSSNTYEFETYEGVLNIFSEKIIENRIHRATKINRLAYPDAAMLEPEFDDHTFSLAVNHFSIKKLVHKLKCLQGLRGNLYSPRVVYDIDESQEDSSRQLMLIPHPSTYSYNPKKNDDRPQTSKRSLNFESRFECGNLRKAIQIGKYEYELQLNPDTNTTDGFQWFYFQVTNMVPKVYYTFNITNFLAFDSQYNYGMQPLMFSVIDHVVNKTGWKRVGKEIVYYGNNYINESGSKQYKTLSFCISFVYTNDYVYFAYHYPYTYTRLMLKLYPLIKHKTKEVYVRLDRLCKTANEKNEIALLTITGAWNRDGSLGIPLTRRPVIFITGRVHPGETNSSWIIEGIIKFLLRETDPNAIKAREHFIFKIIPMLNPEGVIYGNNRCGLTGMDLNRCWKKPNKITCPEIYHAKRLIGCARKVLNLPIAAYIDIHGHSKKKFFFLYGCNPMDSWNKKDKANGDFSEILKILPEMVHSTNPNISLAQCQNSISKDKEPTARVVMWREFDIQHSYTLECSFSFANDIQSMNTKILINIGASLISAIGKIADKVYTTGKSIPSLLLDYRNMYSQNNVKHLYKKKTYRSDDDYEETESES